MDKTTRDVRLAHWTEVVKQCQSRPTGMTIRDWVNENGINEKQYHYWQRRVREEVFNKATSLAQLGGIRGPN